MRPPNDPPSDDDDPSAPPPSAADTARAAVVTLVRKLVLYPGAALPWRAADRIRTLGEAACAPLIAILVDHTLRNPKAPGAGWGPVHAAALLGELFALPALEPLLDVLATADKQTPLHEALTHALTPLGRPLVAPILARLPTAIGNYRHELWTLLAGVGVRDPRVFAQLLTVLAESPGKGAMHLADYGDPDALPDLSRALDACWVALADEVPVGHAVFELRDAIVDLGGTLTPAQQAKYERAQWGRRIEMAAASAAQAEPPVGPNAPCSCGSGRPYKLCCLH